MKRPVEENIDLPYFAYDAFKPKEVAFPVISYFVDHIEPIELDYPNYELKHRNGMPMIAEEESTSPIKGFLLYFNDNTVEVKVRKNNKEKIENWDGYEYISKTKHSDLFKWKVEAIGTTGFNMAISKKKSFGVPYNIFKGDYSGKNDPTFFEIIKFIRDNIKAMKEDGEIYDPFECSCNLQMNYMLLWSSIDKYLALCYGGWDQRKNVKEWGKSEEFRLAFKDVDRFHEINSVRDKKKFKLLPGDPAKSIEYYYQLRCNVIHSGKKENTDISFLLESLEELLKIYYNVLKLSFYPERYGEYVLSDWRRLLDDTPII